MFRVFPLGRSGTKPPCGRGLNLANPLTRGLVLAAPYNEAAGIPVNRVNMRAAVVTSPTLIGWGGTSAGTARTNLSGDASGAYDTFTTPSVSTSYFTIEALISASAYATASGDSGPIAGFPQLTYLSLGGNSTPNVAFAVINNAVGFQSTRTIPLDVPVLLHLTYDGSTARLYIDGTLAASLATAQTAYTETIVRTFNKGNASAGNMIGSLISAHVWDYPLSASQAAERAADPWGIYQPSPIARFWIAPSSTTFLTASDSASLIDSASLSATISALDAATLADSAGLAAFLSALESASLLDSASAAATLAAVDSAGLADVSALDLLFAVLDSAGLTEAQVVAVLAVASDSAVLDEFALVSELIFAADDAFMLDLASLNMNIPSRVTGYAAPIGGVPDPRFSRLRYL